MEACGRHLLLGACTGPKKMQAVPLHAAVEPPTTGAAGQGLVTGLLKSGNLAGSLQDVTGEHHAGGGVGQPRHARGERAGGVGRRVGGVERSVGRGGVAPAAGVKGVDVAGLRGWAGEGRVAFGMDVRLDGALDC